MASEYRGWKRTRHLLRNRASPLRQRSLHGFNGNAASCVDWSTTPKTSGFVQSACISSVIQDPPALWTLLQQLRHYLFGHRSQRCHDRLAIRVKPALNTSAHSSPLAVDEAVRIIFFLSSHNSRINLAAISCWRTPAALTNHHFSAENSYPFVIAAVVMATTRTDLIKQGDSSCIDGLINYSRVWAQSLQRVQC